MGSDFLEIEVYSRLLQSYCYCCVVDHHGDTNTLLHRTVVSFVAAETSPQAQGSKEFPNMILSPRYCRGGVMNT